MKYTKDGVVEDIAPERAKKYEAMGWTKVNESTVKQVDEIVRLKPPVKIKTTVNVLEEAKINDKGDE